MPKRIFGRGIEGFLFGAAGGNGNNAGGLAISDTAAHVAQIVDIQDLELWSVQLLTLSGSTLAATNFWKVEVSNDYLSPTSLPILNQPANTGDWNDITSLFSATNPCLGPTAIVAVVSGASAQTIVCYHSAWRALRITATATSGSGTAQALFSGKGLG